MNSMWILVYHVLLIYRHNKHSEIIIIVIHIKNRNLHLFLRILCFNSISKLKEFINNIVGIFKINQIF